LRDGDRIVVGSTVLRFSLVDEMDAEFHARMGSLLAVDDLTGLVASRKFDAALRHAYRAARRSKAPLSVLVMDIDNLKAINDAYGHSAGGFVIAEVGRLLREAIGDRGMVTRFGGDEFAAFLTGHDRAAGTSVGEEILRRIATDRFPRDGVLLKTTVSIGMANHPGSARSAQALVKAADQALYRAKARGKNTIAT
jgi:diguanylate cyclase (GGDEF)-like protein